MSSCLTFGRRHLACFGALGPGEGLNVSSYVASGRLCSLLLASPTNMGKPIWQFPQASGSGLSGSCLRCLETTEFWK